ncbi:YdhW family putative oxidoreductase system protein [Budvicia diplopodorum]|uniref:YdhW family putative oxidoreductase system protein n=1 Tax=Budvicia diplopodorum TaxID=1119056 RepID=UPI001FEBE4E2|nr:YdhW family putative oxidoreductase system protein [Budvicia diplopodorum]
MMNELNKAELLTPEPAPELLVEERLSAGEHDADERIDRNKRRLFGVANQEAGAIQREIELAEQALAEQSLSPAQVIADFIRQSSAGGSIVAYSLFLAPPYSVSATDLNCIFAEINSDEAYTDIATRQGDKDSYYFSTDTLSENYADMCVLVIEKDICKTIAQAVRFECKTYPRPYKVSMLTHSPYDFDPQQIDAAMVAFNTHPDYADIRQVEASNNEPYLFSERYMSYGKAYGLCEWFEIEQHQNP